MVAKKQPEQPSNVAAVPIFARMGDEYQLGEETYNYKKFSLNGIGELKNEFAKIKFPLLPMAGATFGQMVVEGSVGTADYVPLRKLIQLLTVQGIPENIFDDAGGDEIAAVIDTFFSQSGMRWIDTILKNFVPRAETVMQTELLTVVDEALLNRKNGTKQDGGTENPSDS